MLEPFSYIPCSNDHERFFPKTGKVSAVIKHVKACADVCSRCNLGCPHIDLFPEYTDKIRLLTRDVLWDELFSTWVFFQELLVRMDNYRRVIEYGIIQSTDLPESLLGLLTLRDETLEALSQALIGFRNTNPAFLSPHFFAQLVTFLEHLCQYVRTYDSESLSGLRQEFIDLKRQLDTPLETLVMRINQRCRDHVEGLRSKNTL